MNFYKSTNQTSPYIVSASIPLEVCKPDRPAPTHKQIEELAYTLWQRAGCPKGWDDHFWFRAERQLYGN